MLLYDIYLFCILVIWPHDEKKKKKKKIPINLDDLDAQSSPAPAETKKVEDLPEVADKEKQTKAEKIAIADDMDLDDFSNLKKKKKKKRGQPLFDMDALGDSLPVSLAMLLVSNIFVVWDLWCWKLA